MAKFIHSSSILYYIIYIYIHTQVWTTLKETETNKKQITMSTRKKIGKNQTNQGMCTWLCFLLCILLWQLSINTDIFLQVCICMLQIGWWDSLFLLGDRGNEDGLLNRVPQLLCAVKALSISLFSSTFLYFSGEINLLHLNLQRFENGNETFYSTLKKYATGWNLMHDIVMLEWLKFIAGIIML